MLALEVSRRQFAAVQKNNGRRRMSKCIRRACRPVVGCQKMVGCQEAAHRASAAGGMKKYMAELNRLVMGQEHSAPRVEDQSSPTTSTSPPADNSERPSLDSLIAEAAAYGDGDKSESLEEKAQKALDCPCIAQLRSGPCGVRFSEAFVCFLKSTAEEKGSDCVGPFVALQNCIKANPDAFPEDVLEDKDVKEDGKPGPQYNIRPPLWAVESDTPSQ